VSIILVTGTDTGVGKTLIAAALAAALRRRGTRVGVAKPVETGCRTTPDGLYPEDAAALAAAADAREPLDVICPYRLPDPLAPAVAAERAGVAIDVATLVAGLRIRAAAHDLLLVEGAGGLLVPITRTTSFADLAATLGAEALVVVGSRLGAVNHALLTLAVLATRGLPVRGYVLNRLAPPGDLAAETNAPLLRSLTAVPCLGEMPWLGDAAPLLAALRAGGDARAAACTRLAALAEAHLDLDAVSGAR